MVAERYFYHITRSASKILKQGLVPGKGRDGVWLDSSLEHLTEINRRFPLKNGRVLRIDSSFLDELKFRESKHIILGECTWWVYRGVIPPEAIVYSDEGG